MEVAVPALTVALRPRAFVGVRGPQAGEYLQRMLSNDVLALGVGGCCEALLLTPKARVIAPMHVLRRDADDFLLVTEAELGETVREHLHRMRLAARCEIALERHRSHLVLGTGAAPPAGALAFRNDDYGVACWEVLDADEPAGVEQLDAERLELLRVQAGRPRYGHEIDDRVLPAEAGLDRRAISFEKGCYPGQEPVARLRYRGHVNRSLRVLTIDAQAPPPYDSPIEHAGRAVGRVTSAVAADGAVVALGFVREDVPEDAVVFVAGSAATMSRPRP